MVLLQVRQRNLCHRASISTTFTQKQTPHFRTQFQLPQSETTPILRSSLLRPQSELSLSNSKGHPAIARPVLSQERFFQGTPVPKSAPGRIGTPFVPQAFTRANDRFHQFRRAQTPITLQNGIVSLLFNLVFPHSLRRRKNNQLKRRYAKSVINTSQFG